MCDCHLGDARAYRPVRGPSVARYAHTRLKNWESGRLIAAGATNVDSNAAVRIEMITTGGDGQPLAPAPMPYLDVGALLFDGSATIAAVRNVLDDYGTWVPAVDEHSGRDDLAVFLGTGIMPRGESRERLEDPGVAGSYHFLSPTEPSLIRTLGAFRHIDDQQGTLYLSDYLVAGLSHSNVLGGTSFAVCAPLPFDLD